jgi:predicted amidohydrolase
MPDRIRIACVQMTSRQDKAANLERAESLVARAASTGADVVVLPEKWNLIGSADDYRAAAEPLDGGPSVEAMSRWARALGITLVGGSITERREGREKLSNTSCVFDPEGGLVAVYRKIHLFDVAIPDGARYAESEGVRAGDQVVLAATALGRIGLTICYDLRFPELFRRLATLGAEILTIPSAFTLYTGKDHWEVLVRARAVENLAYVLAPAQVGKHGPRRETFGNAMIVDPWGVVLARCPDGEGVCVAPFRRERLERVRRELPALKHRRL